MSNYFHFFPAVVGNLFSVKINVIGTVIKLSKVEYEFWGFFILSFIQGGRWLKLHPRRPGHSPVGWTVTTLNHRNST